MHLSNIYLICTFLILVTNYEITLKNLLQEVHAKYLSKEL